MLIVLLVAIVIILLLYQRWSKRDIYKLSKQLNSGISTLPFIGHLYLFIGREQVMVKAIQKLRCDALRNENGLTSFWRGNYLHTVIADADAAELVLKTCLSKDDFLHHVTRFAIGNGSIFAPVPIWRPRRKLLVPSFSTKKLKYFMTIFVKQSSVLLENMEKMAGNGSLSAFKYYTAFTMDTIGESAVGYKINAQKEVDNPFLKATETFLKNFAERIFHPWLYFDLLHNNLPHYPRLVTIKKDIVNILTELIKAKRIEIKEINCSHEEYENSSDGISKTFLESLIRLSGGDEGYTDDELIEELLVMLVAGNDTTAVAMSFTSLMLSRHPEIQEKVYKELQEVFGDSDRPITFKDLPRLKYLDAVIRETLRLYPPVPMITRKVEKDVILPSGIKLVPGTGAIIMIWAANRNPRYWGDDAELFRPERFIDTPLKHPAAFTSFSYGPRNCVGYQYSMISMKTTLSSVLRRYRFLPAVPPNNNSEYPPLRLKYDLMLKDADGFQIQIESRR